MCLSAMIAHSKAKEALIWEDINQVSETATGMTIIIKSKNSVITSRPSVS